MKPAIDLRYCKGCAICIYMCPKKCFSRGVDLSEKGYFAAVVNAPENCFNHKREGKLICELCILSCPDQAISWHPDDEEGPQ
ncbi:MAG: ferredoxin family protein [Thermoplasmata archaeon]|nr:ferredoxin family protein [Thermoplasmata archaeon]